MRVAVELDPDEVAGEAEIPGVADVDVLHDRHVVQDRLGVVRPGLGVEGHEQETRRPDRTSRAAAATRSGVIRFSAPFSSSGPQRPQFLHAS